MERVYVGPLSGWVRSLVREKRACGYDYETPERVLVRFDRFTAERYPDATTVTREMALEWATRLESESPSSLRRRINPVRQLALHMVRMGHPAFAVEMSWFAKEERPRPRVLTRQELAMFFAAADRYPACPRNPNRDVVAPALFRTAYCLGLRPSEATGLRVRDVDLEVGSADIIQSKGDKDRTVLMSTDLREYLVAYDAEMRRRDPGRTVFFPNWRGGHVSIKNIDNWFGEIWLSIPEDVRPGGPKPTPQCLRHTFACNRIALWADEGRDVRSVIYYLSLHMGHSSFHETEYYLHFMPERFPGLIGKMSAIDGAVVPKAARHG